MTRAPEAIPDLAARLNRACRCTTLDRTSLMESMTTRADDAATLRTSLEARPHLFSSTTVFVTPAQMAAMQGIIRAVENTVARPAWRKRILARAPEIARIDLGARGVFLGYDFHLHSDGAQLIEINTNAGGGLLNALLGHAQLACCQPLNKATEQPTLLPDVEQVYREMFLAEWRRSRAAQTLARIAIVDDAPMEQYLYPEFLLFRTLFGHHNLEAVIVDARDLVWRDGTLWHDGRRINLVYNRLTDFYLTAPAHAALRAAYEAGAVVLTPHPRTHALYADKRNLAHLSDPDFLRALGLPESDITTLLQGVPRTLTVDAAHAAMLWADRRRYFFKPATGYGSKAAYRGDKITRRVWSEILGADYVAQETVPPSQRTLQVNGDAQDLKLDVRAYVYDGVIQTLAARLYQGQTTNFRTPGGGFAPIVMVPENLRDPETWMRTATDCLEGT